MDSSDIKILRELISNSRLPLSQLAKKVRLSREVVTYRVKRLQNEGIIQNFITEIDTAKLGFVGAAVFVNVKATHQAEFRKHLMQSPFISWVAELSGVWSFAFSVLGRTNGEVDNRFAEIYSKFKDAIIDHRFTLHRKNHYFYEKYFGEHQPIMKSPTTTGHNLDKKDKIILKSLANNSRIESVELSKLVNLSAPAVVNRIKEMKNSGIIERFSIFIDTSKMGLFQYSVFVVNKDIDKKNTLINYLRAHKKVSFIAEYAGDQFLEFGIFVDNPYLLRGVLQEIEEAFPSNRVIEVSLFQKEFVSVGPPPCVFE